MKIWPQVKLGQVEVGLNIAQNHSSNEVISGHYLPQCIWKIDQRWNWVKLGVGSNIAQKHWSSEVISGNAYEKLTNGEIGSSWSRFEHYSKSLV